MRKSQDIMVFTVSILLSKIVVHRADTLKGDVRWESQQLIIKPLLLADLAIFPIFLDEILFFHTFAVNFFPPPARILRCFTGAWLVGGNHLNQCCRVCQSVLDRINIIRKWQHNHTPYAIDSNDWICLYNMNTTNQVHDNNVIYLFGDMFLVACTRLYSSLCRSVCRSFRNHFVFLYFFIIFQLFSCKEVYKRGFLTFFGTCWPLVFFFSSFFFSFCFSHCSWHLITFSVY